MASPVRPSRGAVDYSKYSPGAADVLGLFQQKSPTVPSPGQVSGAHVNWSPEKKPYVLSREREEASQLAHRLERADRDYDVLQRTTNLAKAYSDTVRAFTDQASREVALLEAERQALAGRSWAARSQATAEVVATTKVIHQNVKERTDLRDQWATLLEQSEGAAAGRARRTKEAAAERLELAAAADSAHAAEVSHRRGLQTLHRRRTELARLQAACEKYSHEVTLLAGKVESLERSNEATVKLKEQAMDEAESAMVATARAQEILDERNAEVRQTEIDIEECGQAVVEYDEKEVELSHTLNVEQEQCRQAQRSSALVQQELTAVIDKRREKEVELVRVRRDLNRTTLEVQRYEELLKNAQSSLERLKDSNREEELELEKSRAQRARRISEVAQEKEAVRADAMGALAAADCARRDERLGGRRAQELGLELAAAQATEREETAALQSEVNILEKVTATLQEEVAEHVSQKKELTTLMETIATLEGDLHHSMTEESRAETELRTAKLDLQRAEQKCAALSAELNDHTQWHEQETDAGRQHQEFIEMEHESMMRTHHQQVSGDRERQDRMDKELRAGASRIVSLEEKLTQLLSEEKAAKLECEEQMSFAKELRVKKVEVELRVRELEDKRKQVAADMEREQKDLEARKAEACRMYETADERRVQLSAGADLKGQMLRDTERETRMLEESYSRAQRELEQDVREVREAAAACDSTWDADQRSRSAEKEKVTGYRDEVELTCRKAEDEHQVHLARLRAEEKRIREAGDAERSELSKRVIDLEAEASVFGREYDEQVRRINSMEETLWTLQRELETFLTAAQPAPVKRSA